MRPLSFMKVNDLLPLSGSSRLKVSLESALRSCDANLESLALFLIVIDYDWLCI